MDSHLRFNHMRCADGDCARINSRTKRGKGIFTVERKYPNGINIGKLNDTIWSLMNPYVKYPIRITRTPAASDVLDFSKIHEVIVHFEGELIWDPEDGEKPFDDRNREPSRSEYIYGFRQWYYSWLFPERKIGYYGGALRMMDDSDPSDFQSLYKDITTSDHPGGSYINRVVKAGFKVDVRNNRFYSITGIIRNY